MKKALSKKHSVLRGIIVPSDWDDEGNVLAVSLETDGERSYQLCWNGKNKKLLRYLKEYVEITGVLSEISGAGDVLVVTKVSKVRPALTS